VAARRSPLIRPVRVVVRAGTYEGDERSRHRGGADRCAVARCLAGTSKGPAAVSARRCAADRARDDPGLDRDRHGSSGRIGAGGGGRGPQGRRAGHDSRAAVQADRQSVSTCKAGRFHDLGAWKAGRSPEGVGGSRGQARAGRAAGGTRKYAEPPAGAVSHPAAATFARAAGRDRRRLSSPPLPLIVGCWPLASLVEEIGDQAKAPGKMWPRGALGRGAPAGSWTASSASAVAAHRLSADAGGRANRRVNPGPRAPPRGQPRAGACRAAERRPAVPIASRQKPRWRSPPPLPLGPAAPRRRSSRRVGRDGSLGSGEHWRGPARGARTAR
jgi:hypothetical protein